MKRKITTCIIFLISSIITGTALGAVLLGVTLGRKQSLTIPLTSINFPQQRTEEIDGEIITGYFVGSVIKITNKGTGEEFFLNNGEPIQAEQDYTLDSPVEGIYRVDILPYYDFKGIIMQDPRNMGFIFAEFEFQPGPPGSPLNFKIIIK
jgi:hypothetical protein